MNLADDLRREMMAGDVPPRVAPMMHQAAIVFDRIEAWIEDVDDGGPVFLDRLKAILRGES